MRPAVTVDPEDFGMRSHLATATCDGMIEQCRTRAALGATRAAEITTETRILAAAPIHRRLRQDRAWHAQGVKAQRRRGRIDARRDRMLTRWRIGQVGCRPRFRMPLCVDGRTRPPDFP